MTFNSDFLDSLLPSGVQQEPPSSCASEKWEHFLEIDGSTAITSGALAAVAPGEPAVSSSACMPCPPVPDESARINLQTAMNAASTPAAVHVPSWAEPGICRPAAATLSAHAVTSVGMQRLSSGVCFMTAQLVDRPLPVHM